MSGKKLVRVFAKRDFSSTIYGNLVKGQALNIPPDRAKHWVAIGLVEEGKPDIDAMSKAQLVEFAQTRFGLKMDKRQKAETMKKELQGYLEAEE